MGGGGEGSDKNAGHMPSTGLDKGLTAHVTFQCRWRTIPGLWEVRAEHLEVSRKPTRVPRPAALASGPQPPEPLSLPGTLRARLAPGSQCRTSGLTDPPGPFLDR